MQFLSACAEDVPESPYGTKRALQDHFGMQSTSFDDEECRAINLICDQVCTRAGCLVAAALNVLVRRVEDCGEKLDKLSIGTDGSLLQKHPTFKSHVRSWLLWLMKDMRHIRITMDFVEDASGIGAAVTAACHAL